LIIRTYLEARYGIPALENTTEEILSALRSKWLTSSNNKLLMEILTLADLVKFARAEPSSEVHSSTLQQAKVFVESTKFVPINNDSER
jgi:hypothetical protein